MCVLIVSVTALAATSIVFLRVWFGPTEPAYRGTPLSAWLDGSMVRNRTYPREMGEVLASVGPEALPWLVWAVEHYDNQVRFAWRYVHFYQTSKWAQKLLPSPPRAVMRWRGARHNAVGMLARLAPGTQYEADFADILVSMRPNPSDREFAKIGVYALGCCTNSAATVLPVLLQGVTNSVVMDASTEALRHFSPRATPPLYRMALAETGFFRPAEVALENVDKNAYARLQAERERNKSR